MNLAQVNNPRLKVGSSPNSLNIRIRAGGSISQSIVLTILLTTMAIGALIIIGALLQRFDPVLVGFSWAWALAWAVLANRLLWTLFGTEELSLEGAELRILRKTPLWSRQRTFPIAAIRGLQVAPPHRWPFREGVSHPFDDQNDGSVRFEYDSRAVYAASGLTENEGRMIAGLLKQRLSQSVSPAA